MGLGFMAFHLLIVEILEITDGGGTFMALQSFVAIYPIVEIFQSGTKW